MEDDQRDNGDVVGVSAAHRRKEKLYDGIRDERLRHGTPDPRRDTATREWGTDTSTANEAIVAAMWTGVLVVLLGATLWVLVKLQKKESFSPILAVSLLFCFALWYFIPILLTIALWGTNTSYGFQLKVFGVDYDGYVRVALIETAAFLAVCATLLCIRRPFFTAVRKTSFAKLRVEPSIALTVLLVGAAVVVYAQFTTADMLGADYLERNAFLVTADSETLGISSIVTLASELLTCFAYAAILTRWPEGGSSRLIRWVSWGWVLYSTATQLLTGARIVLLAPVVLYVMYKRTFGRWSKAQIAQIVAVAIVATLIGAPLASLVGELRGSADITAESLEAEAAERPDLAFQEQVNHSIQEIVVKFNSPLSGQMLLETGTGYGWQPFIGAMLALVPRVIMPTKPVPGSMTDDYNGHPTRIVAVLQGMERTTGNVQVSPAAISMWELRYPGLVLLFLANLFALYLMNSLLLSESIASRTLALYMIGAPIFYTLFSSPDNVVQTVQRVALILLFGIIISRLFTGASEPAGASVRVDSAAF